MITGIFHSDLLNKNFATEKEAVEAERAYQEKVKQEQMRKAEEQKRLEKIRAERTARAKEVDAAFKAAIEARKHANELLDKFIKDYGSFHATFAEGSEKDPNGNADKFFKDLFESFFSIF